jgi:hypothetical protein
MKNTLLLGIMLAASSYAQSGITDILSMIDATKAAQSIALTITASQGDNTKCTITKFAGSKPYVGLKCIPGDGISQLSQANMTLGTTVQTLFWGYGDVACLLALNPTAAAVTIGSLGSVSAVSLAWSCSTNIDTAGVPTGQTAIVAGSVAWP